jgi:hypothetical protein
MKRASTIFLQVVIVLISIGVLTFLLWEPHLEGVNAHATLFQIYFKDPFLAYVYAASIPFFLGLYQALKLLGYARKNKVFSQGAVKALRTIKYCAFITAGAIVAAITYIRMAAHGNDDPAGFVMLGMVATFASVVIGTAAAVFERILQNAVDIKSENDLTV